MTKVTEEERKLEKRGREKHWRPLKIPPSPEIQFKEGKQENLKFNFE